MGVCCHLMGKLPPAGRVRHMDRSSKWAWTEPMDLQLWEIRCQRPRPKAKRGCVLLQQQWEEWSLEWSWAACCERWNKGWEDFRKLYERAGSGKQPGFFLNCHESIPWPWDIRGPCFAKEHEAHKKPATASDWSGGREEVSDFPGRKQFNFLS